MDHALIGEQLLARCTWFIGHILHAVELRSVAAASQAILAHMRDVARAELQAKVEPEVQQCRPHALPSCGSVSLHAGLGGGVGAAYQGDDP